MASTKNNIENIRKNINMPEALPQEMIVDISDTVCIRTWKNAEQKYKEAEQLGNKEGMEKQTRIMEKADMGYEKLFGYKIPRFEKLSDIGTIKNFGLIGPPGYGKTASIRLGAKVAAEAMGMNFIESEGLDSNYIPDSENDFLFIPVDLAGAISPTSIAGLPTIKKDNKGEKYTSSAGTRAFNLSRNSAASLILYDDVGNAHSRVITALLQVLHGGRYGDDSTGDGATICIASNIAGDGSDPSATSKTLGDAIFTRVRSFFVMDTPSDWVRRLEEDITNGKYRDFDMKDKSKLLAFAEMVNTLPEMFYEKSPKAPGGKVNARSLSGLLENLLKILNRNQIADISKYSKEQRDMIATGQIKGPNATLEKSIQAFIGKNHSSDVVSFFSAYLTGAKPLADKLIKHIDTKEVYNVIKEIKEKMGNSNAQELGFGSNFMHSLNSNLGLMFQKELINHNSNINDIMSKFKDNEDASKEEVYQYIKNETDITKLGKILAFGLSNLSPHLQGSYIRDMRDVFMKFIPKESPLMISASNGDSGLVMSAPLSRNLIESLVKTSKIEERDNDNPLVKIELDEIIASVMRDFRSSDFNSQTLS